MSVPSVDKASSLRVASYNICAPEYNHHFRKSDLYRTRACVQDPSGSARWEALARKIHSLNSDIVCLQEVSQKHYPRLEGRLKRLGYEGTFVPYHGRADGIATFYKREVVRLVPESTSRYYFEHPTQRGPKGEPLFDRTGKAALVQIFRTRSDQQFTVSNMHPEGGRPDPTNGDKRTQIFQVHDLLTRYPGPHITCGDLNTTWSDPLAAECLSGRLTGLGQDHLYLRDPSAVSTVMNDGTQIRLDYILSDMPPSDIRIVGNPTEVMTLREPSDHLPVVATFPIQVSPSAAAIPSAAEIPALATHNHQSGTDAQPSFQRWLFYQFNRYALDRKLSQGNYDQLATYLEKAISEADARCTTPMTRDQYTFFLNQAITNQARSLDEFATLLRLVNEYCLGIPSHDPSFAPHLPPSIPPGSYRHALMTDFNQRFLHVFGPQPILYQLLSSCFAQMIHQADFVVGQKSSPKNFLDLCLDEVQRIAPPIYRPYFENLFKCFALENLIKMNSLLSQGKFDQAHKLIKHVPSSLMNEIFGATYQVAKKEGHRTDHGDFGRVAFCKDQGSDVPDSVRMKAIQTVLLKETATMVKTFRADGFVMFSKLPLALQHQVYGEVYHIEKEAGRDTNHRDFGNAAFHNKDGKNVSDDVRAQAILRVMTKL